MAACDQPEPVIASSNRHKDIEAYTNKLFAENPKVWMQVLPWEFPQQNCNTREQMKEKEEQFLRRFFSEREIRMQGGADGDGLGFCFLKQVWYCAALWNYNYRLPAVVNWWRQHNQELVHDRSMHAHFFKSDVQPSTFFEAPEIEMYGEKFLGWAIKQIQFELDPEFVKQRDAKAVSYTDVTNATTDEKFKEEASKTALPESVAVTPSTNENEQSSACSVEAVAVAKPSSSLPASATPMVSSGHELQSHSAGVELPASSELQGTSADKDGTLSNNRLDERPPRSSGETKTFLGQLSTGNPTPPEFTRGMPFHAPAQSRRPSGGMAYHSMPNQIHPFHRGQPLQPPPMMTSVYGSSMHTGYGPGFPIDHPSFPPGHPMGYQHNVYHNERFQSGSINAHGHFFDPSHFMQSMSDRNNFQMDNHFSSAQPSFGLDNRADQQIKQRGESMSFRGGKGRGYSGSMRGRGSRGRNSFCQPNGTMNSESVFKFDDANTPPDQDRNPKNRRFGSNPNGSLQRPIWPPHAQKENSMPQETPPLNHARLVDSKNRFTNSFATQSSGEEAVQHAQMTIPQKSGPSARYHGSDKRKASYNGPSACGAGCDRRRIDETCTTAKKLIIFDIVRDCEAHRLKSFLQDSFGPVDNVHIPSKAGFPGKIAYVTFLSVKNARECLSAAQEGFFWPGIDHRFHAEIAKEHWDPNFVVVAKDPYTKTHSYGFGPYRGGREKGHWTSFSSSSTNPELPSNDVTPKASKQNIRKAPNDDACESSTPTTSQASTPGKTTNKKNKMRTFKKSPQKKKALYEEDDSSKDGATKAYPRHSFVSQTKTSNSIEGAAEHTSTRATITKPEAENESKAQPQTNKASGSIDLSAQSSVEVDSIVTTSSDVRAASLEGSIRDQDEIGGKSAIQAVDVPDSTIRAEPSHKPDNVAQQGDTRKEDDMADESFVTAIGSQDQEPDLTSSKQTPATTSLTNSKNPHDSVDAAATGNSTVLEDSKSIDSRNETGAQCAHVLPKMRKDPKFHSTDASMETGLKDQSVGKDVLQIPGQRSASDSSDAPATAFVTAPNTPAFQETSTTPQPKKAGKQKGPDQTESFSIFGGRNKEKKSKKKKGGSVRNGKPNLESNINSKPGGASKNNLLNDMATTEVPEQVSFATQAIGTEATEQDDEHYDESTKPGTEQVEAQVCDKPKDVDCQTSDETCTSNEASRRPSRLDSFKSTLGGLFGRSGIQAPQLDLDRQNDDSNLPCPSDAIYGTTEEETVAAATVESVKTLVVNGDAVDTDVDKSLILDVVDIKTKTPPEIQSDQEPGGESDTVGLGIFSDDAEGCDDKSKKKPKKKQKKSSTSQAIEPPVPATSSQTNASILVSIKSRTHSDTSPNADAQPSSASSSPGRKVAAELEKLDRHLVTARAARRKPRRLHSSPRQEDAVPKVVSAIHSNVSAQIPSSPRVILIIPPDAPINDVEQQTAPVVPRQQGEVLDLGNVSDSENRVMSAEVEASREKFRQLQEAEEKKKKSRASSEEK